ncbi:MAG: TolC family protein [Acidobacteria bacterium]|nr:TolC family protein [Acidobacteriota bacterium]
MRTIAWAVVIACVVAGGPAWAQTTPLSIDEAVARALKESHRAAELRARREGAEAAAEGRAAARRPQLSAQGGYTRTNHVDEFGVPQPNGLTRIIYPDIPDNYRTRLDLAWPLYTGGRAESLARAARADAGAAAQDVASLEADLGLEVTRAYWNAVTAAHTAHVVEQALARTDSHLKDLRERLEAGFIPPNDVLSAEAQRSRHEVQVIEARNASEVALAELRRLTGLEPGLRLDLTTPLDAVRPPDPEDLAAQVARAKGARPDRAALVRRLDGAAARVSAAGASRRPSVAVNAGVDYARPNTRIFPRRSAWEDSWDVSVNAAWSLWDGGRRAAEVGETTAAERALRARLAEFDSLVELDVRQRRLDLEAGRAAATAAADGVRSAAEARRVVGERFTAGVATSTDVLDAQVALLQAELDRARALAAVRIAEARLARTLGQ